MKRGYLERNEDVSGVSGTGKVSTFTINDDGRTVVFWPTGHSYFGSLEEAIAIHGHGGKTRFVILDDDEVSHCIKCHRIWDDLGINSIGGCGDHDFGCPGCLATASS